MDQLLLVHTEEYSFSVFLKKNFHRVVHLTKVSDIYNCITKIKFSGRVGDINIIKGKGQSYIEYHTCTSIKDIGSYSLQFRLKKPYNKRIKLI